MGVPGGGTVISTEMATGIPLGQATGTLVYDTFQFRCYTAADTLALSEPKGHGE